MKEIHRNILFLFFVLAFSFCSFFVQSFEGFLQKIQILEMNCALYDNQERSIVNRYALLLAKPIEVVLLTGNSYRAFFFLLQMEGDFTPFIDKYVSVVGDWNGIDFFSFEKIPIFKVNEIWEISDFCQEDSFNFENQVPYFMQAACKLARWKILVSGFKVLEIEDDQLVELSPDGKKTWIRSLIP